MIAAVIITVILFNFQPLILKLIFKMTIKPGRN